MLNIEFDSRALGDILSEHVEEVAVYDPTQAEFHCPKGNGPARLVLSCDVTYILYPCEKTRQFLHEAIRALSAALVWNDDVMGGAP